MTDISPGISAKVSKERFKESEMRADNRGENERERALLKNID